MMAHDYDHFNAEPIMLRHCSSLAISANDKYLDIYGAADQPRYSPIQCDSDNGTVVPQHLDPEQASYEFPPRSLLHYLARLDHDNDMFDDSSFTTTTATTGLASDDQFSSFITSIVSSYANFQHDDRRSSASNCGGGRNLMTRSPGWSHKMDCDDDDDEGDIDLLVDDSLLSPLQLPRARKWSCDSGATAIHRTDPSAAAEVAAPSSFLSYYENDSDLVYPKNRPPPQPTSVSSGVSSYHGMSDSEGTHNLPVFRNESEPMMDEDANDSSSECDSVSKVIMVKFHKSLGRKSTCHVSDEGYDDDDDRADDNDADDNNNSSSSEMPMESVSVFLPLTPEEQEYLVDRDMLRHAAATRIQAAWRGYRARKHTSTATSTQGMLQTPYNLVVGLANICNNMHRQQLARMQRQIDELEGRVEEESMMRVAFEKAVEDMTVLIDQQQTMLYDRIELQRVQYEQKVQQLESRIRKESKTRVDMEQSMAQIMKQMQEMQLSHQRRVKEDANANNLIQRKLNDALQEVAQLKEQQQQQQRKLIPPTPPVVSKNTIPESRPAALARRKTIVPAPPSKNNNTTASSSWAAKRPSVVPRTSRAVAVTPAQTPNRSRRPTLLQKR